MYVLKSKNDAISAKLAENVAEYMKSKKMDFTIDRKPDCRGMKSSIIQSNVAMVIAVGDDKLLLGTFRELGDREVPVLGIASVQSFLMQANALNFKHCIDLLSKGKYTLFKRSRLLAEFNSKKTIMALNDIGLFSSESASLMKYTLNINSEKVWNDSADGIITATPTGSTGYSLSAGGPVVVGEPEILVITPISSSEKHSPVVVSDKLIVNIIEIQAKKPVVVLDGEIRLPLEGNSLSIKKSDSSANFIKFPQEPAIGEKLKKRPQAIETEKIKALPPSAKLIYKILVSEEGMTQKEIIARSYLPERTARHSLSLLYAKSLIKKKPYLNDARQDVYSI